MKVTDTRIEGCKLIKLDRHIDARGFFEESWTFDPSDEVDVGVQDNVSVSFKNVLRGLHLQTWRSQHKYVRCLGGEVFDVCVDLRPDSPTFKQWQGFHLSWEHSLAVLIPAGCAHGFYVTGEAACVYYKCSELYDKKSDTGIYWNDPEIGIEWPMKPGNEPIMSPRDQALPNLKDYLASLEKNR